MNHRNSNQKAFSLVELVIVIIILGVIAAIAIPRISSGSKNAGDAALRANLATLRNAIDWYYGEHSMVFPGAKADGLANAAESYEALVNQLTMYSKADGSCSADKNSAFPFGPYLRNGFPKLTVGVNAGKNTVNIVNQVTPLTSTSADGNGWVYSVATGQIIANADQTGNDGVTAFDAY
ncbi:MAG: type II secretion system protein [Sedimentisphaerales bacterium]|nr:type II secretion system protein [Sedimentisphaerales bacterium]